MFALVLAALLRLFGSRRKAFFLIRCAANTVYSFRRSFQTLSMCIQNYGMRFYCAVHGFMQSLVDDLQGELDRPMGKRAQVPRDLTRISFGGIRPIMMKKEDANMSARPIPRLQKASQSVKTASSQTGCQGGKTIEEMRNSESRVGVKAVRLS